MKLSYIFIGIGIALLIFLFLIPFFIGSRISSDTGRNIGIFKSVDGGLSWSLAVRSSELTASLPRNVLSFVFHPKDARIIYLGTKGGGLWVSKTGGETWARITDAKGDLKPTAEIYDISISPRNPDVIYLAAYQDDYGKVFRSNDGGLSFDEVYIVSLRRYGVFGVAADSSAVNRVYLITGQGGFLVSDDRGDSWHVEKWFPDGLVRLIANPINNGEFYVVSSRGELYRTENAGESWLRLSEGYRVFQGAGEIQDVTLDASNTSTIYTGSKFGVLRSQNSGKIWRAVPVIIPPTALPVRAVVIDPRNSAKIFVSAASTVYRSDDFGERWQILQLPTVEPIKMLRVSPEDSNVIYAIAGR
ncbi:MAG: hypothetical protein HY471_01755 [Candidatus Sungbacteria bacterium]|nr:hypothetical protein [Candidatus Sungbacteria bacterium]